MQLIRAKVMIILENRTFPERKEKESLSLFFALWKKCFFLLHPQAPQQSAAYEKETSNRGYRPGMDSLIEWEGSRPL